MSRRVENSKNFRLQISDGGCRSRHPKSKARNPKSSRRGVLLLVVLSMLVLFMLIGTAFLMTSSQERTGATNSAKKNRLGNDAQDLLHRALLQVVRGSDNPNSAIRYHDLLRDLYGTDGFQAEVYSPPAQDFATPQGQVPRYAGATMTTAALGATFGQLIDIYVRQLPAPVSTPDGLVGANDVLTTVNDSAASPDTRHVLALVRDVLGQPQVQQLSLTRGYYNGCLLTMTSGPAAGQSTRIVDYEYVGDGTDTRPATDSAPAATSRIFRFRVMAFQRADGTRMFTRGEMPGSPINSGANNNRGYELFDLVTEERDPRNANNLRKRGGHTFVVNGRPFSGTGAGYNQFAAAGQARLNALELLFPDSSGDVLAAELALLPNSRYFNPLTLNYPSLSPNNPLAAPASNWINLFRPEPATNFLPLNIPDPNSLVTRYADFAGPGGMDESYDAADFQNMWLALVSVTPRAQGRVWQEGEPQPLSALDPALDPDEFLRLDLEDVPWPSFHRPDLINFWYHRLLDLFVASGMDENEAARAILQPYDANWNPTPPLEPAQAALIAAIKRKISLRPVREDHPHFDGGNEFSVPKALPDTLVRNGQIAIPYWEAVGPWDVDNDNDGVPDSVWVDLGDPVLELEDGTRYKALYSFLIVDLDSRLNVNAHGLADHIDPPNLASSIDPMTGATATGAAARNLAGGVFNSNRLAQGLGSGPAEISLRPVFPQPWTNLAGATLAGNCWEDSSGSGQQELPPTDAPIDDYATLLRGRKLLDRSGLSGRYGYLESQTNTQRVAPGLNYLFVANPLAPTGDATVPELAAQLKYFNFPWAISQRTAFGTPPDLFGRYAIGVDYGGQPVYEVLNDLNPAAPAAPNHLLANSPYELNLNSAQRRDEWAADFANAADAFNTSLDQNDDAPFATADLERVLRGFDPDSGTLPSRLWDVVDAFDPLKLIQFDPYRVTSYANDLLDPVGRSIPRPNLNVQPSPELLTGAEHMAAINRRLVTTDSYDLPVPAGTVPNQPMLAVGADGAPGRFQSRGGNNDLTRLNAPISDDFRPLFGKEVSQANVIDLLRYRIWKQVRGELMQQNGQDEAALAGLNDTDYQAFLVEVSRQAEARITGEPYVDTNVNGMFDVGENFTDVNGNNLYDPPMAQLLAPELYAGIRMDVNRPFGDGRDNGDGMDNDNDGFIDEQAEPGDPIMNGVVDDPLEAGDPFLDKNGNGKWDGVNETYADLDGNRYTPPRDRLWQGLVAESAAINFVEFDYTNGQGIQIHKDVANTAGVSPAATVRNLESQARQLYARHLYCLMLLLMDENYIAPWDGNDPQVLAWVDKIKKELTAAPSSVPAEQADFIAMRKLTCRLVAQWAVNCADMCDADVIMTPFEYDEFPWDGWGCRDAKGNVVPLDGDPATDENKGQMIDWNAVARNNNTKQIATMAAGDAPLAVNRTRGVVWGAERPELLITETLAFHDRATEDLQANDFSSNQVAHGLLNETDQSRRDDDMDQSLQPRGSLFVEVKNPWSEQGQFPTELYSLIDSSTGRMADRNNDGVVNASDFMGVELGRLSNFAVDANGNLSTLPSTTAIKRSPVWRIIVVEDWPNIRNKDPLDEMRQDVVVQGNAPTAYKPMSDAIQQWKFDMGPPPYHAPDPDLSEVFDANFKPSRTTGAPPNIPGAPNLPGTSPNKFRVQYPYVEREFYFTTDNSRVMAFEPLDPRANSFKLRIPARFIEHNIMPPLANPNRLGALQTQRFIAPIRQAGDFSNPAVLTDVPIAPILPGRYGVIGSAGAQYRPNERTFTTTIGRLVVTQNSRTQDGQHAPTQTRRIELRPDPNPNMSQVIVSKNGGDPKDEVQRGVAPNPPETDPATAEMGRDNELINNRGTVQNITDQDNDGLPDAPPAFYQPCVAIPVEDMNVSEPAWGWAPREKEAWDAEGRSGAPYRFNPRAANGEGRYVGGTSTGTNPDSFDVPFDNSRDLVRNGTTPNYRTIHLQRLANPLYPWNPEPLLPNGSPNPEHRPNLPINPYRSIDASSVNLTAFNGVTGSEGTYPTGGQQNLLLQKRPWVPAEIADYMTQLQQGRQVWYFRSLERGFWSRANVAGAAANANFVPQQRVLWAQEPAMVDLKKPNPSVDIYDLLVGRNMTMRADEVPPNVKANLGMQAPNHVDMVMEHTLGFGNESLGLLYDRQGRATDLPAAAAVGAPRPTEFTFIRPSNRTTFDEDVNSTTPWLAWGNRPFLSADELLNVPASSASQMLRNYKTIGMFGTRNPYDGTGLNNPTAAPTAPNNLENPAERLAEFYSPFGHLLNMLATAALPADVLRNSTTGLPELDPAGPQGHVRPYGAPHFYRILDYVHVPSRYVGTETMLTAEIFNDVPNYVAGTEPIGSNILGPGDPRYLLQPPYNKVSRQRDPGRVNLNTVTGRRIVDTNGVPWIWSDVYDGIMHRSRDRDTATQLGHLGPAWRDVVLSRKGYAQYNANNPTMNGDYSVEKPADGALPDVFAMGLSRGFPTVFANPFRSSEAGFLVPLPQLMQYGVDASWLRSHPRSRGNNNRWGDNNADDGDGFDNNNDGNVDEFLEPGDLYMNGLVDDAREAGLHNDEVSHRGPGPREYRAVPEQEFRGSDDRESVPLFSELSTTPFVDAPRNPYMTYQPRSRLSNLVTNRSNVFAVWITVGYFEVEPAPNWSNNEGDVHRHFGGDGTANSAATAAALAVYNRAYPEGYMLGREVGSDTGDIKRHRGFYIIDRTEEVGFKPGEDLNVEKMIRLRRRIE